MDSQHVQQRPDPERKQALQALRASRKASIARATETVKRQRRETQAILAFLGKAPATVPEFAAATGMPSAEVLWYVAALKKYGRVAEAEKNEGYSAIDRSRRRMLRKPGLLKEN